MVRLFSFGKDLDTKEPFSQRDSRRATVLPVRGSAATSYTKFFPIAAPGDALPPWR